MDQQFRLKWNNHCNTLLQVFGNLLKTETLVDCTIGADGQYLKAHKVVVSACSPYFQSLFTEHFDKHPIIILKDIKFSELQSMIDYMYEGEVNISQDQLPSFLKAAASIQLKGLTQNVKPEQPETPKPMPQLNNAPRGMLSNGSLTPSSMLNVELEEGQQRKKRKMEPHPPSSASSSPSLVPDLVVPNVILDVPGENNSQGGGQPQNGQPGGGPTGENMKKEPSEYSGRSEDEEEDGMSHDGWDLSNDGLHDSNSTLSASDRGPGHMHHGGPPGANRAPGGGPNPALTGPDMSNVDENNQELHNAAWDMFSGHSILDSDTQLTTTGSSYPFRNITRFRDGYPCPICKKMYKTRKTLQVHVRFQCGKNPQFKCPLCPKTAFQKVHIEMHVWGTHKMIGWKYWNKDQPTDGTNRPHAMPKLALLGKMSDDPRTTESSLSGEKILECKRQPNETQPLFVKPKPVAKKETKGEIDKSVAKAEPIVPVLNKMESEYTESQSVKVKTEPVLHHEIEIPPDERRTVVKTEPVVEAEKESVFAKESVAEAKKESVVLESVAEAKKESVVVKESVAEAKKESVVKESVAEAKKESVVVKESVAEAVKESIVKEGRKSGRLAAKIKVEAGSELKGRKSRVTS